jgi:hypothetical protein
MGDYGGAELLLVKLFHNLLAKALLLVEQDTLTHARFSAQVLDIRRNRLGALAEGTANLPAWQQLSELGVDPGWLADNLVLLERLPALTKLQFGPGDDSGDRASSAQWDALLEALAQAVPRLAVLVMPDDHERAGMESAPRPAFLRLMQARPELQVLHMQRFSYGLGSGYRGLKPLQAACSW